MCIFNAFNSNPNGTFPHVHSKRPPKTRPGHCPALPCPRAGKLGSQLLELAKLTFPQFCAFCDNSRISKPGKPTVQAAQSQKSDQDPETIRIDFKLYVSHMHSGRPPRTHPDRPKPEIRSGAGNHPNRSAGSQKSIEICLLLDSLVIGFPYYWIPFIIGITYYWIPAILDFRTTGILYYCIPVIRGIQAGTSWKPLLVALSWLKRQDGNLPGMFSLAQNLASGFADEPGKTTSLVQRSFLAAQHARSLSHRH